MRLDLSDTGLRTIPSSSFKNLTMLEVLDLSHNELTILTSDAFVHVPTLKVLDVAMNKIEKFEIVALAALPDLEHLSIAYAFTDDVSIKGSFYQLTQLNQLQSIDISGTIIPLSEFSQFPLKTAVLQNHLSFKIDHFEPFNKLEKVDVMGNTELASGQFNKLNRNSFATRIHKVFSKLGVGATEVCHAMYQHKLNKF